MSIQLEAPTPVDPSRVLLPPGTAELCRNCEAPRVGDYCHTCGQHFLEGRLSVRSLTVEFVAQKLSLQRGFLRTFWELCIRPGGMIRDYVNGRRQRYTNPVGYLTLATAASLLLRPFWHEQYAQSLYAGAAADPLGQAWVEAMLWLDRYPLASALLVSVLFAPLLRLFFGKRTTLAEAAAFSFYVFAQVTWLGLIVTAGALANGADPVRAQESTSLVFLLGLIGFAAAGFFGARLSVFLRMAASLGLALIAMVTLLLVTVVMLVLARGAVPAAG